MFKKVEKLNENLCNNETLWKCLSNKNQKFGVCNYKDNIVLPFIFDNVIGIPSCFNNGSALVELNGEKFYIK